MRECHRPIRAATSVLFGRLHGWRLHRRRPCWWALARPHRAGSASARHRAVSTTATTRRTLGRYARPATTVTTIFGSTRQAQPGKPVQRFIADTRMTGDRPPYAGRIPCCCSGSTPHWSSPSCRLPAVRRAADGGRGDVTWARWCASGACGPQSGRCRQRSGQPAFMSPPVGAGRDKALLRGSRHGAASAAAALAPAVWCAGSHGLVLPDHALSSTGSSETPAETACGRWSARAQHLPPLPPPTHVLREARARHHSRHTI